MRGEIIYKILDFLEDRATSTIDFVGAFLDAGYGASFGKLEYEKNKREDARIDYKLARDRKRNLQKYLSRLKSNGLIVEDSKTNKIHISSSGKEKLKLLKSEAVVKKESFEKAPGERVVIVSYDIPIPFNRERTKLREIIKILGFSLVHKSVWVGKVKLPKNFILALEKMNILDFVEIMEVTQSGSLKSHNL